MTAHKDLLPLLLATWFMTSSLDVKAQALHDYTSADSTRIVAWLQNVRPCKGKTMEIVNIGKKMLGVPYVGQTLEHNAKERLVVNVHELDCTTFLESTLALYLCAAEGLTTFDDYCSKLQTLRYADGKPSYATRLHYFSSWIDENTRKGLFEVIDKPYKVFSSTQSLHLDYMTTHSDSYPMLKGKPQLIAKIGSMEKKLEGATCRYIPKETLNRQAELRKVIRDGDIIAIVTNKKGLDISHVGFACWHKDGLHLLNASSIHKKVVDEPMTLYTYMQKHPSQLGIRILRCTK